MLYQVERSFQNADWHRRADAILFRLDSGGKRLSFIRMIRLQVHTPVPLAGVGDEQLLIGAMSLPKLALVTTIEPC